MTATPPYDAICIGRLGIDFYPETVGLPLAAQARFSRSLGGSPTNVVVGLARLGARVALVSGVGDDGFGDYAVAALGSFGVETRWVHRRAGRRTPVVFAEILPPDRFPLLFYRETPAPDEMLATDDLDLAATSAARCLWVTGGSLAAEPVRGTVLAALSARDRRGAILDLDWRPSQWAGVADPPGQYRDAIALAEMVIGNEDEFCVTTGRSDPADAVAVVEKLGARVVVMKQGPRGVSARERGGPWVSLPAIPTDVVCGLGAGDAFGAAFVHGRLAGWSLARTLAFANAAGAIVASRLHCADAMPTAAEIDALLADRGKAAATQATVVAAPTRREEIW